MVRGLERRAIFRDDADRADFVARLAALADAGALTVYAWALLPNHAHLLVRTRARPLARSMRSLLTGYAGAFNRRHHRVGHLFQNRYKSIVVEAEPYLLELVRYLHLCHPGRCFRMFPNLLKGALSAVTHQVGPAGVSGNPKETGATGESQDERDLCDSPIQARRALGVRRVLRGVVGSVE
jgi:REP element-mobilizing transposase RayT